MPKTNFPGYNTWFRSVAGLDENEIQEVIKWHNSTYTWLFVLIVLYSDSKSCHTAQLRLCRLKSSLNSRHATSNPRFRCRPKSTPNAWIHVKVWNKRSIISIQPYLVTSSVNLVTRFYLLDCEWIRFLPRRFSYSKFLRLVRYIDFSCTPGV